MIWGEATPLWLGGILGVVELIEWLLDFIM